MANGNGKRKITINNKEGTFQQSPFLYDLWLMEKRLTSLAEIVDWDFIHQEEKKKLKNALFYIENFLEKVREEIEAEELREKEESEKQLTDAYREWANDPNEWKDVKAKY